MANYQDNRVAALSGSAIPENLWLYRMNGSELLSRLFEYELELLSDDDAISLSSLLGTNVTIKLELTDGSTRYFNGLVTKVSQHGMLGRLYAYRMTVYPKIWLLTRASNCRIMSNLSVTDIVKKVLSEHNYTDINLQLQETYPVREYCVQYRESDFNFISRLLEEEGIYYFFQHTDTTHTLVLCDSPSAHQDMPGVSKVNYFASGANPTQGGEYITEWVLHQEIQSGVYLLDDFDFTTPTADLSSTSTIPGGHLEADKKLYDYPGGYVKASEGSASQKVTADGKRYVKVRMQQQRAQFETINAQGDIRALATGFKFTLTDFPRDDQNREYLALATFFTIQNNGYESYGIINSAEEYHCSYNLLSTAFNYRPPRVTPVPVVQGVQTAIVAGQSGDEITTDKYGRIKVQFHWDKVGKHNENSSCWIRVAHIWAGKNWGGVFIPRIGQEVIVDFLEGNPDRPIIIGSVYNQDQMPPYTLPDNKTQSGILTRSTTGGSSDNYNEIRFEDKINSEEIYVHAEKDFNRVVENNDTLKVGYDKKTDGDQTISIYNNRTVTIDQGNDKLTINTGNRIVDVKTGDDTLTIETGNRAATVKQGNDELNISMGNRTVTLDQGSHKLEISMGDHSVNVSLGSISQQAMQSIAFKVGDNAICIDQSGVSISGLKVDIKGDLMVNIKGGLMTEVKGLMTTVKADAFMVVNGTIVMIN